MYRLSTLLFVGLSIIFASCADGVVEQKESKHKYSYQTVEGDPLETLIYTLDNGLKLYMSVNKDEPRVVTQIAVKTGSKQDPADATGLAHYLEHMLFKGSSQFGTKDWEQERVLLQQISDLYEEHRNTQDENERKSIYHKIDSVSSLAANFAIANEYDKMIGSLGAKGTNAYTSFDQTVYINDIPANELEKWAKLESDRFRELVLRLFHTELETVYEEFNRGLDTDSRTAFFAMLELLFDSHPYGTQTTIGTSEHLKNPSMEKIHQYFEARYRPNNMAIVLSGDIDPDATVEIIEKYFGSYEKKPMEEPDFGEQAPLKEHIVKDITGVQPEFVIVGYQLPGAGTKETLLAEVMDGILSNGKAGLIDLNLMQKQRVLQAYSAPMTMKDHGVFYLMGSPRQNQDVNEVADLLREQLELVKNGEFDDWLIEAVVNDKKLTELRRSESNWGRASVMVNAFIYDLDWNTVVNRYDEMAKITKQDVVDFANKWFGDNYVQINKRLGENLAVKVEKPTITQLTLDRETKSPFYLAWDSIESSRLEPLFLDYNKLINTSKFDNGIEFNSIKNESNELFSLYYILDMGTDHDLETGLAVSYLPYLGTKDMSAEDVQKELFKLGVSFDVFSSRKRTYVTLSGLNESFEEGVKFFENLLANVEPDTDAYNEMVSGILKSRQDAMKNKGRILQGAMADYAKYGPNNPTRHILSAEELLAINPQDLTEKIKGLTTYKHQIFYYGPQKADEVKALISKYHKLPETLKDYPAPVEFKELETNDNQVYFTHYDMVQAEMLMISKGPKFDVSLAPQINLFNQYFGSGLSSIVFQEIRESKALAYSAYSAFSLPTEKDESHYIRAYVGSQVDKLPDAVDAMLALMSDIPRADIQYESARDAAMKKIETSRTTRASIFWSYLTAKERGLDYDIQEEIYKQLQTTEFEDLQTFFDENIKNKSYVYSVIGNKSMVDMDALKKLGPVKTLTLEEIFGYPEGVSNTQAVIN